MANMNFQRSHGGYICLHDVRIKRFKLNYVPITEHRGGMITQVPGWSHHPQLLLWVTDHLQRILSILGGLAQSLTQTLHANLF
jgi:hypothetical protein